MRSAWSNLLWKEWREQRWMLGFGCLMTTAVAAVGLRSRVIPDEALLAALNTVAVALLPVLTTMGLMPAERANGTLAALLALPVPPRRVLAAKALLGALLSAGPLAAAGLVSLVLAGGREMASADVAGLFLRSVAAALSLYAWMFVLAVRLPSEARAGFVSVGVLVGWAIVYTGAAFGLLPNWLWVLCPFIFKTGGFEFTGLVPYVHPSALMARWLVAGLCQSAVAALLWVIVARRFDPSTEGRP